MGWTASWWALGIASLVGLLSARLNARRGTSGLGLVPWDYLMLTAVVAWFAAAAHILHLWSGR